MVRPGQLTECLKAGGSLVGWGAEAAVGESLQNGDQMYCF